MKVILTEKVPSLGNVGEIVNVSPGHGRNYLIPKKFAVLADESNQKQINDQKRRLSKKVDEQKNVALETKKKLDGVVLQFEKKTGSNGRLFGTVTNTELAGELKSKDIEIERRLIIVNQPIKSIGEYTAKVKLFTDVEAEFKVKVIMDVKQALEEKKKSEIAAKKTKDKKAKAKLDAGEKDSVIAKEEEGKEEVENEETTDKEIKDFEQETETVKE